MMTQEAAAKYMIVAWIKDWSLYTYLRTVTGKLSPDCNDAHEVYPWLPTGAVRFDRKYARRFIADNFPKLNEMLWNASSDKDRLALYSMVMRPVGANHRVRKDEARIEAARAKSDLRRAHLAEAISIDAMRKGSGHNWATVK